MNATSRLEPTVFAGTLPAGWGRVSGAPPAGNPVVRIAVNATESSPRS